MENKDRLELEEKAVGIVKETASQMMQKIKQAFDKALYGYRVTYKAAGSNRKQYKIVCRQEGKNSSRMLVGWPSLTKNGPIDKGESSMKIMIIHSPHGGYIWLGKITKREIKNLRLSRQTIDNYAIKATIAAILLNAWMDCETHPDKIVRLFYDRKDEQLFWKCSACEARQNLPPSLQKQVLSVTDNDFLNKITIT